jgi:hypothetical protein
MRALRSKLALALFVGLFLALLVLAMLGQGTPWQRFAIAGEIVLALACSASCWPG